MDNSDIKSESLSKLNVRLPALLALGFGLLATSTTITCAALEGRLFSAEHGVQPYLWNLSTIADFLLLDPLIIFCFGLSIQAMRSLRIPFPIRQLVGVGACLGFASMLGYISSFRTGRFLDALVIGPGIKNITVTGWTAFLWTWIVLSFVYFSAVAHFYYIRYVCRLTRADIAYRPLHEDNCGGHHRYASPSWYFTNGMAAGLLVFIGFYIQDKVINHMQDSNRLAYFALYVVLAPSLFLPPVLHLRRLMLASKREMISDLQHRFELAFRSSGMGGSPPKECGELIDLRKNFSTFPEWPLPIAQLVGSVAYWVGPLMPALKALATLIGKQLKP